MDRYDHFTEDLKVLGNNAEEMIRQVIATCTWAYKYHYLTKRIEGPYLPYLLWSLTPRVESWRTPAIRPGHCNDYHAEIKRGWRYLIILLQFWMDNNATSHIQGGPVRPISPLANIVKETANLILPEGFRICWKNVVEDTPWYRHRDFARLLPVSPEPVNRLEKAMRLFHEKTDKILRQNWANRQGWISRSPVAETINTRRPEEDEPIAGQFDDEDLGHDMFDPLETAMTTPVQNEGNATTVPLEHQPATPSQEVEDVPMSQAKRRFPTFTSPRYRQDEIASWEEPACPPGMPELLSRTPGTTPRTTPKPSPKTTPKTTPQTSPNRPSPCKSSLRGHTRGAVNSPSGRGRGTFLSP